MKKVLFVATLVKNHMMEFHLPYLALFQEKGWHTAVAARNDYDDPAQCRIPHCDVFFDLPYQRSPLSPDNWRAYKGLRKIVKEGSYDLIHCHTPVGAMTARLAAAGTGTKVIYTAHGLHFYQGAPKINWLIYFPVEWMLARLTDVLITINQEDYSFASRHLKAKRVVYIPGVGIDTAKFRPDKARALALRESLDIPRDARVLLSVGDLNANKNHAAVLEALAKTPEPFHYLVCGRGPLKGELEAKAEALGLGDRVKFLGYRDDVKDFYALADAFVFPSFREGLSVSVMEAMAAGVPVLCSAIRGNTDMVGDKVNGLLFDPADVDAIAAALAEATPENCRTWGERNARQAERFDLSAIVPHYQKIYEETLGETL